VLLIESKSAWRKESEKQTKDSSEHETLFTLDELSSLFLSHFVILSLGGGLDERELWSERLKNKSLGKYEATCNQVLISRR
jgi:hypothetical protein